MAAVPITHKDNFYSRRLSGTAARIYDALISALDSGALTASVSADGDNVIAAAEAAIEAVLYGCPELFFLDQSVQTRLDGGTLTVTFSDKYGGDTAALWQKLNAEIERIAAKIRVLKSDRDKLYRLNQYLCARVKGVNGTDSRYGDAYGALILKAARCEGYCKAAQLILDRVGMDCMIVLGEAIWRGERIPHSWNIVFADGVPYAFDFTWNAGYTVGTVYGADYMFLPDSDINVEHFPKYDDYPECKDGSQTFWAINNGEVKYVSDLSRIKIVPIGRGYLAAARFDAPPDKAEVDACAETWMVNELHAFDYGRQITFRYNEKLGLVVFYFLNDD